MTEVPELPRWGLYMLLDFSEDGANEVGDAGGGKVPECVPKETAHDGEQDCAQQEGHGCLAAAVVCGVCWHKGADLLWICDARGSCEWYSNGRGYFVQGYSGGVGGGECVGGEDDGVAMWADLRCW